MKNVIKMLAVAGLMTAGFAQAAVPADINAAPGVLFVNWNATAAMAGKANPMLEVRDESGDLLASVHANLMGTQTERDAVVAALIPQAHRQVALGAARDLDLLGAHQAGVNRCQQTA